MVYTIYTIYIQYILVHTVFDFDCVPNRTGQERYKVETFNVKYWSLSTQV